MDGCSDDEIRAGSNSTSPEDRTLAITFYQAARAEIVQRLAMREQVLLASLTVSGVLAGFAFKGAVAGTLGSPEKWLLMLITFFTLPFSLAHRRHSRIIDLLGMYMWSELDPFLRQPRDLPNKQRILATLTGKEVPTHVRHWDHSLTIQGPIRRFLRAETIIHIFLICAPAMAVLMFLAPYYHSISIPYVMGCITTGLSLVALVSHFKEAVMCQSLQGSVWPTFGA
jgi:hypothetical protein